MEEQLQNTYICDICTWRNRWDICALGVDPEEQCPGFSTKPCEECEHNPCLCRPEDFEEKSTENYLDEGDEILFEEATDEFFEQMTKCSHKND